MTDYGDFKVQSEALRTESKVWGGKAGNASKALSLISDAVKQGKAFGVMAGSCGVSDDYNKWSLAMQQAITDAERCFDYIDAALVSAANAYDGSDATAATSMNTLNNMADLSKPMPPNAPLPPGVTAPPPSGGANGPVITPPGGSSPGPVIPTPTPTQPHGEIV